MLYANVQYSHSKSHTMFIQQVYVDKVGTQNPNITWHYHKLARGEFYECQV